MKSVFAWAEHVARRAGVAGALGAALITFASGSYFSVVRPLESQTEALRLDIAARRDASRDSSPEDIRRVRHEQVTAFHDLFLPPGDVPATLAKIYRVAEAENLPLPRGEYRPVGEKAERPHRIQVSLPVKGSYRQIRRFIAGTLAAIPTLALDEIVFQRNSANDVLIEAQIRLTLFVGEAS